LDVHKETVVACVRATSANKATRECRTYATTTEGLLALLEWLNLSRCSVAAMEATGVYWLPVFKILSEGEFELVLANAAHIKAVPGRKTDMNDAMWIADLAAHGLIKASFVPDEHRHGLRTLTRTRKQLVREQTRHVQRIQKTLTEANIRPDSVLSDIMGASGRRMIGAKDRRRARSAQTGGSGRSRGQSHAEGIVRCAAWAADRPSPLPSQAPPRPVGRSQRIDQGRRRRSRRPGGAHGHGGAGR
jgi:transposase